MTTSRAYKTGDGGVGLVQRPHRWPEAARSFFLFGLFAWLGLGVSGGEAPGAGDGRQGEPGGEEAENQMAEKGTARAMGLLRANCFSCHNDEKRKGGLRLTSREKLLAGGDDGAVVVPGKADESLLAKALLAEADPHMPPKRQLSAEQIGVLRAWIDAGAPWDAKALAEGAWSTTLDQLGPLPAGYEPALAVTLSPDGRRLAAGRGNEIVIHEVGPADTALSGQEPSEPRKAGKEGETDGKRKVGQDADREKRKAPGRVMQGLRDAAQSLAWSPDGARLAAGGYREILVWDADTMKLSARLTNGLLGRVTALEFMPDGKGLVAADGETAKSGWIHLWNPGSAKPEKSFAAHQDTIFALRLSRDGKWLATGGADRLVKLWSWPEGKEAAKFEGHSGHVMALAFNQDDTWLASAGADKEIKIWELKTRDKIIALNNQSAGVTGLSWTPDGKTLVAVCEDGSGRAFTGFKAHQGGENSDGADMRKLEETGQMLYGVAASADGKRIYAGAFDGSVLVWEGGKKARRVAGD